MKSDVQAAMIFNNCPNLVKNFFSFNPKAGYRFSVPEMKAIVQRFDGLYEPEDKSEPTFVIEFQAQTDPLIFVRLQSEMATYLKKKRDRQVQGILILTKRIDLSKCVWSRLAEDCPWLIKVVYLRDVVEQDPLLQATFGLFLETKESVIAASLKGWYETIHQSEYRDTLETVFFSWLFARIKKKGKEAPMWVQNLLGTKLEEIPYFKELEKRGKKQGIAIGEKRGKEQGIAIGEERGIAIGEERGIAIGEERGEERGKAIGEERGIAIGQIKLLQELRGLPIDSEETLRNLSQETLQAKLDQLKALPMGQA